MRLTLAIHDIGSITLGAVTRLEGNKLEVDPVELRQLLLEDSRLQSVDIETVSPGEECRIGVVYDIIEPRAKAIAFNPIVNTSPACISPAPPAIVFVKVTRFVVVSAAL